MHLKKWFSGFCALLLVALLNGCGNNSSSSGNTNPQSNSVFVTGSDAPLPSVVGFRVDLTGLTLSDGTSTPVSRAERNADGRLRPVERTAHSA